MSSIPDAIHAITAVIHDPDLDLSFEDKEELFYVNGLLLDYIPGGVLD